MSRILVTGGSGFIGSALVKALDWLRGTPTALMQPRLALYVGSFLNDPAEANASRSFANSALTRSGSAFGAGRAGASSLRGAMRHSCSSVSAKHGSSKPMRLATFSISPSIRATSCNPI